MLIGGISDVDPDEISVSVWDLRVVVELSGLVVLVTSFVLSVEVDTIDSVGSVGLAIVTEEVCISVGDDIIVEDDSFLAGGTSVVFI